MKGKRRNLYPWALGASFLILTTLIGFLIFNTYQYKDKNYQVAQIDSIQRAYGPLVMNDKIFPGGDSIFKQVLVPYLPIWLEKQEQHAPDITQYGQQVMQTFMEQMREKQPLDSIFEHIIQEEHLDPALSYAIHFDKLEIYMPHTKRWQVFFESPAMAQNGLISGKLENRNDNNHVFHLSVSDNVSAVIYRFTYSMYVDYADRTWRILQAMWPVFLVSLICIGLIVFLNYKTYKNWMNQRKLADLKTSFLDHMRHEFNTPLTTIMVCAHSLTDREEDIDKKEVAQLGNIVERQARRLKDYFGQVMESVSLQEQLPKMTTVPLDSYTQMVLDELQLRYKGQIWITYIPLEEKREIEVDETYYFSILDNFVSNAIKFNNKEQKHIRFSWKKEINHLCLEVEDNGTGMHDADIKSIFIAFYRGQSIGNTPGLGLGLYYVKSCLDKMGWTISVKKSDDNGTVFLIDIPTER